MTPNNSKDPLSFFHPLIRKWFRESLGVPTDVQSRAWPEIALGKHALVMAPTGSGKTLTAFLWSNNQLVTGAWEPGRTRVLYVSPLKALNNDVQRNLIKPIDELKTFFLRSDEKFPLLGVLTRSGDTPAGTVILNEVEVDQMFTQVGFKIIEFDKINRRKSFVCLRSCFKRVPLRHNTLIVVFIKMRISRCIFYDSRHEFRAVNRGGVLLEAG